MGGGTGGGGGGRTGPPQTFQRLTLCLWALHGKNRLQMVLVPPPQSSRRGAALALLYLFRFWMFWEVMALCPLHFTVRDIKKFADAPSPKLPAGHDNGIAVK